MRPTPVKILMLLENNAYPNDPRVNRETIALVEAGFQVSIIAPHRKDQPWVETINGVHTYRFPTPLDADGFLGYLIEFGYALIVMFLLSIVVLFRRGFHVIHAHNPPDILVLIALIYKLLGKKFVFDHHDLSPELYMAKSGGDGNKTVKKALLFFEKLTFRFANHVIATNESYKNIAMTRGNVTEDNITIVRNGPFLEKLTEVEPDPQIINKASKRIGYIGQIELQDGLDYLIRSIYYIVNDLNEKDIILILIGRGNAVSSLKLLAKELGVQDYIHFAGYQPEEIWRPMLAGVHLGVVPDPLNDFNNNSTMIKITDYMGLAKPVVAFDLRENRVTAGSAAFYAKANDEIDFAKQIVRLLDSPDLQTSMGKIGYERVVSELAWEYQAKKLIDIYHRIFL